MAGDHHRAGVASAEAAAAPPGRRDDAVGALVAAKLLDAWLTNRHQTLMPHTLNFRSLAADEVSLLIAIMAAAAQSDGPVSAATRNQAARALSLVHADAGETAAHAAALELPQPLSHLLHAARRTEVGSHAYAAALLSIDRTAPTAAAFLGYVAAVLALPADLARALESRYRA